MNHNSINSKGKREKIYVYIFISSLPPLGKEILNATSYKQDYYGLVHKVTKVEYNTYNYPLRGK